ncbi:DNA-binding transcriptional regulator, MarR family [Arthrobacter sp. 9V]|uniref:MarR family winged helix-turn-helix transcriptional regulator n=1 Tax=Arthrobacter sp. 9V TaxID=2653132 RepID=UPI0012F28306|nr:MarR family winged helix-turn-helix transcriptional regulator [Arthrobacter sp. 9V]VXC47117.1 DNA-binding transcriptional regulator, MarR family [Arthrobacter sp. 9V]
MNEQSPDSMKAPDDEALLETIGTAFSKLRRRTSSVPLDPPIERTNIQRDLLLAVVEESDGLLSVNAVAAALSMDRTAVSRLVARCVSEGLLERVASQTDGRSITLRLASQGHQTLAHSRRQQRQAFDYITKDWEHEERIQFARLLHKYVTATASLPRPSTDD